MRSVSDNRRIREKPHAHSKDIYWIGDQASTENGGSIPASHLVRNGNVHHLVANERRCSLAPTTVSALDGETGLTMTHPSRVGNRRVVFNLSYPPRSPRR